MTYDPNREILELERARVAREEIAAAAAEYAALSKFDKFKLEAARAWAKIKGLAGANPYALLPMFIDYSHWNGMTHNWTALKGRIICAVHKIGEVDDALDTGDRWNDAAFQTNFGGSAGAGIPSMGYFFDDGGAYAVNHNWSQDERTYTPIWLDPKITVIVRQLAYNPQWVEDTSIDGGKRLTVNGWRPFKAIVIDVERHWKSYTEYGKYLRGEISSYTKMSPSWINFSARLLIDRLQYMMNRGMMKKVPIIIYTRKSFVDGYSPDLAVTLARTNILRWPAHYYWGAGNVVTTLEEIREKYLPAETWRHYEIYGASSMLQWSGDRFRIPECGTGAVDVNFYMGTEEQFALQFGVDVVDPVDPPTPPPPDPDPEPTPDLTALTERVDVLEDWAGALTARIAAVEAKAHSTHTTTGG